MITKEIKYWRIPVDGYLVYEDDSCGSKSLRWVIEMPDPFDPLGSRCSMGGKCWLRKDYLIIGRWKSIVDPTTKTEKEWREKLEKLPLWNRSKYILKIGDIGAGAIYSDGRGRVTNEKEITSILRDLKGII